MQLLQKHVSLQFWSILSLFQWLIFKKEGNHRGKWNKIITTVPVISKPDNTQTGLLQLLIETQGLLTSARQMNSQRNQLIKIKSVSLLSTNISVSQGRIYFPLTILTEDSNFRSYYNTKGFLRLIQAVQHNHIAFRRILNMPLPLPTKLLSNSILVSTDKAPKSMQQQF